MPIVKIAVSVMIDETPVWNLAMPTSPKAVTRLGLEEYTKVVRSAEAELKKQIQKTQKKEEK